MSLHVLEQRKSQRLQNKSIGFTVTKATADMKNAIKKVDFLHLVRIVNLNRSKKCTVNNPREVSPGNSEL